MTVQMIFGLIVLVLVAIVAIAAAWDADGSKVFWLSIRNFIGTYAALTAVCAVIWVVAWIGMFLRSIVIWLMEAVFQPLIALFQLFF